MIKDWHLWLLVALAWVLALIVSLRHHGIF